MSMFDLFGKRWGLKAPSKGISPSKPWPRTGEVIPIYFEVGPKFVSVVESDGSRTPIFPSVRIGGFPVPFEDHRLAGRLRTAIITVMSDMEREDDVGG
jgi:hypothetical protein